jgi:hypothetical protein
MKFLLIAKWKNNSLVEKSGTTTFEVTKVDAPMAHLIGCSETTQHHVYGVPAKGA